MNIKDTDPTPLLASVMITPGDLNKIRTLLDRAKPTSAEDGAWKSGKSSRSK
jgi:hypothetical protein